MCIRIKHILFHYVKDNNFGKNQTLEYDYSNLQTAYSPLMSQISSLETLHSVQMIAVFCE